MLDTPVGVAAELSVVGEPGVGPLDGPAHTEGGWLLGVVGLASWPFFGAYHIGDPGGFVESPHRFAVIGPV